MQIYEGSGHMGMVKNKSAEIFQESVPLLSMLDKGIDDMKAGRELTLDDAFEKIAELRDARRNAGV